MRFSQVVKPETEKNGPSYFFKAYISQILFPI